jgi:hypothetical protein
LPEVEGLRETGGLGVLEAVPALWRRVREVLGEMFDEDDFDTVNVDAARRFSNDPLFRREGLIGEEDIVPIRRLDMDEVNDCVLILRMGATVGAAYKSGILGTGGAFAGVVNVLAVDVFNEGIDRFALTVRNQENKIAIL